VIRLFFGASRSLKSGGTGFQKVQMIEEMAKEIQVG
jgi:hypothetical protein